MRNVKLVLIVIIAYVLQTVIVPDLNICGVAPNLLLVVVCSISFLFGSTVGGTVGFFSGLLLDFNQGRAIGLYAFLCMYIGMALGQFNKRFFKDNYVVAVAITVLVTVFYETLVYIFGAFAYFQEFNFLNFFTTIMFAALVNVITAIIVYPFILKINIGIELNKNIFGK